MFEAYAFLAMFTVQMVTVSILLPMSFIHYVRRQAARYPTDVQRFAQFYPGADLDIVRERFLTRYRLTNWSIVLIGLLLLGWMLTYLRRPNWDVSFIVAVLCVYATVQWLPLMLTAWLGARMKTKVLEHSPPEPRRKAFLQPRRLFDFVSPFAVSLAVAAYLLFAAFAMYARQNADQFVGFKPLLGIALLAALTLTYALSGLAVYRALYGKKLNPIETRAEHVHMIRRSVKASVYGCTACAVFFLILFVLMLLDVDRWLPFTLSTSLVSSALLSLVSFAKLPREPETDQLGSHPAH